MSFIAIDGFRCFKISAYIFVQSVFAAHFCYKGILFLLGHITLSFSFIIKKLHAISVIHHRNVSRDKISLRVAESCFYNKGTRPYQSQTAPAYVFVAVFSPGLYVKATSFSSVLA